MAHVVALFIAPAAQAAMIAQPEVRAVPGRGLEGDRYAIGQGTFSPQPSRPDYEITLIEQEKIDEFVRASGLPFAGADARRNVVTNGVDLNALVGRVFRVGAVEIRGLRLCEPCNHLAKITYPEVLRGLVHQGGLRAQILTAGQIRIGDAIVVDG
jgi:MOSC domain-containing protein YiiM